MKKSAFKTALAWGSCAFLLYLAVYYWTSFSLFIKDIFIAGAPLLIGILIAYIVNIVMSAYERIFFGKCKKNWLLRIKRPLCMILAFLTFAAVTTLVVWLIIPQLIECILTLFGLLPDTINKVVDFFGRHNLLSKNVVATLEAIDWKSRLGQLVDVVTTGFTDVVTVLLQALRDLVTGVITAFISFIFSIYLLFNKEKLKSQMNRACKSFLPKKVYDKVNYVVYNLNVSFRKYLIGQCTEAVILGVLCGIGMAILRLPYVPMISTLIAFTALIPIAGAYIGAGVGALMILASSPIKAVFFLIFIVVLQQIEGNLIYPRVVGSSMGLPGIWVLAAVTVGGGIAGVAGMFLGVPLVAAFYRMFRDALYAKEKENLPADPPPAEES